MSASKKRKSKYQKSQHFLLRHMTWDNFMFFILDMWRHSPLKGGMLSRQVFQLANLLATWQTPACHLATWQNSPTSSDWAQLTLISQKRMNKVSVQRLKYVLSEVATSCFLVHFLHHGACSKSLRWLTKLFKLWFQCFLKHKCMFESKIRPLASFLFIQFTDQSLYVSRSQTI